MVLHSPMAAMLVALFTTRLLMAAMVVEAMPLLLRAARRHLLRAQRSSTSKTLLSDCPGAAATLRRVYDTLSSIQIIVTVTVLTIDYTTYIVHRYM